MGWFRKSKHKCNFELVAVNDEYHTEWTDTNTKEYHQMRFYKCECGSRSITVDKRSNSTHKGIDKARKNWIDAGVVPVKRYHPTELSHYVKIDDVERKQLDPVVAYQKTIEDMVAALGVVINRDYNLEEKYPKLKKAADNYHRELDKYRNFDNLKGKD